MSLPTNLSLRQHIDCGSTNLDREVCETRFELTGDRKGEFRGEFEECSSSAEFFRCIFNKALRRILGAEIEGLIEAEWTFLHNEIFQNAISGLACGSVWACTGAWRVYKIFVSSHPLLLENFSLEIK